MNAHVESKAPANQDVRLAQATPFARPEWLVRALDDLGPPLDCVGPIVAVIDGGFSAALCPALGVQVLPTIQVVAPTIAASPEVVAHGTACAWVVRRMAPEVRIQPVRVFADRLESSPRVIASAIARAIDVGARAISLSMGGTSFDEMKPLYLACEDASRRGVIVVAASRESRSMPAAFSPVIGVAAGRFESPFDFEYSTTSSAEVCASDQPLWPPKAPGLLTHERGSSLSAPIVAALAGLLASRVGLLDASVVRAWLRAHSITARRRLRSDPHSLRSAGSRQR